MRTLTGLLIGNASAKLARRTSLGAHYKKEEKTQNNRIRKAYLASLDGTWACKLLKNSMRMVLSNTLKTTAGVTVPTLASSRKAIMGRSHSISVFFAVSATHHVSEA